MSTRMNISLPDDLKRRMDEVCVQVNWSAIACHAFEQKLGAIASEKREKAMNDVIQRLRGSKLQSDAEMDREGQEAGRAWAKNEAEAVELERLATAHQRYGADWDNVLFDPRSSRSPGEQLFRVLQPTEADDHAMASFWEIALGDEAQKAEDRPFVIAFAAGALDVWYEVADKI